MATTHGERTTEAATSPTQFRVSKRRKEEEEEENDDDDDDNMSSASSDRHSQAKFSRSTIAKIRAKFRNRCSICLCTHSPNATIVAHLFDAGSKGAEQVEAGVKLGLLPQGYSRSEASNATIQCSTCHQGYFRPNIVALSPPLPVLEWLIRKNNQDKSVSVHTRLQELSLSQATADRDVKPYYGLYSLETLRPIEVVQEGVQVSLPTTAWPRLSVLQGGKWVDATDTKDSKAVRIFDVMQAAGNEASDGHISLFREELHGQLLWRIPGDPSVILAALFSRLEQPDYDHSTVLTRALQLKLQLTIARLPPIPEVLMAQAKPNHEGPHDEGQGSDPRNDEMQGAPHNKGGRSGPRDEGAKGDAHDENSSVWGLASDDGFLGESGSEGTRRLVESDDETVAKKRQSAGKKSKRPTWQFGPDLTSDNIILFASGQILH